MLERLSQIAPLSTWGLTLSAAALMLLGFVAYGHARLTREAYGKEFEGPLAPGVHETMLRWCVALLSSGLLLWGVALEWSIWLLAALGAVCGAVLVAELVARVRGVSG